MLRRLLLVSALLFLAACTRAPLVTPQEVFPTERTENAADVRRAIVEALETRGWSVGQESPGLVVASILVRGRHQAWVDIPYSTKGYQIRYRDSAGLDYDGERIHRNYNRWVQQLDADIHRQLQLPAPTTAAE